MITPPATPTPTAAPATAAVPTQVSGALVVADPLLAASVQQVIQHPIARQRPDLLHFSSSSQGGAAPPAGVNAGSAGGPLLPVASIALLIALAVVLARGLTLLVQVRQFARLRAAVALGALALAVPLGAAAAAMSTHVHPPAAPEPHVAGVAGAPMQSSVLNASALRSHHPSQSWAMLVSIEQAIAADHAQLAQTETAISTYNALLTTATTAKATPSASATATPSLPAPAPSSEPAHPALLSVVTTRLSSLVSLHDALASQYNSDLQREYDFFVSTAQSPAQQSDVVLAASQTEPDAANAVAYDLNIVQTQLAQEAAIAAAEAAAAAPSLQPSAPPSGPLKFHAPVGGVVSQGFGPTEFTLEPPLQYQDVFYPHFHTGLDIATAIGTPVGAAADGVVILATSSRDAAGEYTGYGNYVVIEHAGGFVTLYGHLDQLLVTTGQKVKQGQVIGLLGSTGWSTGPHVHFEVRKDGVFVDPAAYIAAQIKH